MQNRASESTKLSSGEIRTGVAIAGGTGLITAVGVVFPILEFIVGGAGGVTGLGITLSGLGSILTISLGGLLAFAVGGLAAYMAYKSYVKTAKELQKETADTKAQAKAAKNELRAEIYEYFMAMMRLYMMKNPTDTRIDSEKLAEIIDANLPKPLEKRPRARENLKKLFSDVVGQDGFKSTIYKITTSPSSYRLLLNSLHGIDPVNDADNDSLSKKHGKVKKTISEYYKLNYHKSIRPMPLADPSYLLDGLLSGLTGFVGVLGVSSSITTIAMGLSFSLAFSFLISNPIGWGMIGAAVLVGVAVGVTYGYMQYTNAQRKEIVKAKQAKVSQLKEESALIKEKTQEIKFSLRKERGMKQEAERQEKAALKEDNNKLRADNAGLSLENDVLKLENDEQGQEIAKLRTQLERIQLEQGRAVSAGVSAQKGHRRNTSCSATFYQSAAISGQGNAVVQAMQPKH